MWFCIDDGDFSNHLWQIRAYGESEQLHETECCVVHHCLFIYWSIPMAMVIVDRMHVVWLFCRDFLARHIFKSRRCNQRRRCSHVCLTGIGWRYREFPWSDHRWNGFRYSWEWSSGRIIMCHYLSDHPVDGFDHIAKTTPTAIKLSALFDSTGLNRLIIFLTDFKEALGLTT